MADVLGVPLSYDPSTSTTLGTAYIGYMAGGLKKNWTDAKEWQHVRENITPDSSLRQMYDEFYAIYLNLYERHKDDFKLITKYS